MTNYYYPNIVLPELHIGERPDINLREFDQLMRDNLIAQDYAKINMLRNFYDIPNLRSYWKEEPLDYLGSLDFSDLEEALATRTMLPDYIFAFLDKYETKEERLEHYPELLATFFHVEIKRASGALKADLILERDLRLILVAFRAKQLGRDLLKELQYEDPEDEIVAQILAQKDAPQYEPPEKYADVKNLLIQYGDDPIALHRALYEYRFNKIEEILELNFFSIDRLLGYMIQLILVERWLHLDKQKGLEIVDSMLEEPK